MKNKLISVTWKDACSKDLDEDILKNLNELEDGENLLETNITYGKLLKVLKKVVIIVTEESTTCTNETVIIPRNWIIKPKRFCLKK